MQPIPDRYWRAAIIGSTQLLPAPARVGRRRRLLWDRQTAETERADAVIIVHPKSGGTWLRVMLFRIFQQKYALPARRVMKTDELYRANSSLPRFVISNGHYSYEAAVTEVLQRAAPETKRLVLMARHPCDIVVSWYLQFTRRISRAKRELILHRMRQPIDYRRISMWDFVMHPELGLPGVIAFHNRWAAFFARRPDGMIVRYEDLRSDPHRYLKRLAIHLGEDVGDESVADAVAFASFENLRRLEAGNYFLNSGLRRKNGKDPNSFKVRRGKVGGYRDYFEPAQLATMDALVRERLDPMLGYGDKPETPVGTHR